MKFFTKRFRRRRYNRRQAERPVTVDHFGVKLPTDPDLVPEFVIELIYAERYERQEAEICLKELRYGDRVLELGAGIGFIGSLAAKICGSENVRTYEANPSVEPIVRRTHKLNGVTPDLRMQAVTKATGPIKFFVNENVVSSSLKDRDFGGGITVDGIALKDAIADFRPTVIVCDIEGAEVDVFTAAELSGVERILIELHPKIVGTAENEAFLKMLEDKGLRFAYGTREKVAFLKR